MNSFEPHDSHSSHTKFAITQLKFKSQSYDRFPKAKSVITPSVSLQNWNKNFIVRQQRKKTRIVHNRNEHFGLMEQEAGEAKNNMFMAWKDRNLSHLRLPSSKVFAETFRSIKKTQSEKKLREVPYDLESRRLTALPKQRLYRPQMQIPAELMAQKLQWECRQTRRINPTAQAKWSNRVKGGDLVDKSAVMKLSGWQYGQNQFETDLL